MPQYPTLRERKEAKVAAISRGVAELCPVLAGYARQHGGRYFLFGSAARGDVRYDSDVDILLDFPVERETAALLFAEHEAFERGLVPDLRSRAWCAPAFLERIAPEQRELL
jgi:predicted nucleotidyltransferase